MSTCAPCRDRLHECDEHLLNRGDVARVAQHDGDALVQIERGPYLARRVAGGGVEAVDGDDERQPLRLEVVDRGEAVTQPPDVGEHDGTERSVGKLVPHEGEALLAGEAEQVERDGAPQRDPAEVERDGGGGLAVDARKVVESDARRGQRLLRAQRPDLADRADKGGLARAEAAGDEDLVRGERTGAWGRPGGRGSWAGRLRVRGGHSESPGARRALFAGWQVAWVPR